MQIQQAQVDFATTRDQQITRSARESLQLFRITADQPPEVVTVEAGSTVSLSARAVQLAARTTSDDPRLMSMFDGKPAAQQTPGEPSTPRLPTVARPEIKAEAADDPLQSLSLDSKTLLIKQVVEQLSGRRIRFVNPVQLSADQQASASPSAEHANTQQTTITPPPSSGEPRIGMHYQRLESYSESEHTQFAARAQIVTADGRELDLTLNLSMSRQFVSESQLTIEAGARLTDPLVVNLGQRGTQLGDETIAFDLDADGSSEQMQFVSASSALLALDKNGDGTINDGSELFGALTGNGFNELSHYDEDGNGFIDQGDAVFADLKLWIREAGEDRLVAVADQGIGAFYVGYADTEFSIKDSQNTLQGMIRSTGVYLNEDGSAGTLQQIDLVT